MFAIVLLISVAVLAGLVLAWWRGARAPRPDATLPATPHAADTHDSHPQPANRDNGLAAFYAYQMAVSRINRA